MIRLLLTATLFFLCSLVYGQMKSNDLSDIKTISQARAFIEKNPRADAKIFTMESGSDTDEIVLPLYTEKAGFTFHIDSIIYKVLEVDSALSFRVSYIFLSGDKFSKNQIDSLRREIISKYKAGVSFFELVRQYNMDGNITGDTRWFTRNMMVKEFEKAVRNHKKGDIFTVDIPEQNWYHVVLKTFDDMFIKKVTLLKMPGSSQN